MVFAKKKWGQNFLVDNNLLEKIIKTIDIKKDDEILEIGPGSGALTKYLINESDNFFVVEIDDDCVNLLKKDFKNSQEIEDRGFFIGLPTKKISNKDLKRLTKCLLDIK